MEKEANIDKNLRCKAEDVVHNAIIEVARLFHENPFFFINEESFRCMLYTKISQHYTELSITKRFRAMKSSYPVHYMQILVYMEFLRTISQI